MANLKRLTVLAGAFEAARRWAASNPDKARDYLGKAGQFINKKTSGKYTGAVDTVIDKVAEAATGQGTKSGQVEGSTTTTTGPTTTGPTTTGSTTTGSTTTGTTTAPPAPPTPTPTPTPEPSTSTPTP